MVAVIVVNYRSEKRTVEFVKNEVSKISVPHRVVVVNNGASEDSDNDMSAALSAKIVKLGERCDNDNYCYIISNPDNPGFARGNNVGAIFAVETFDPEYLLFSNNDIRFLDDSVVDALIDKMQTVPEAGMIGPKIVGLDGNLQSPEPFMSFWDRHIWMYLCTPFYSKKKKVERFNFDYSEKATEGFHYKLMGSFFIVRSADFEAWGMMDENTFLFSEEPILTERMKKLGLQPYYYPHVAVLHDHGATVKNTLGSFKKKEIQFASECYYYKNYIGVSEIQIFLGTIVREVMKAMHK